MEAPDIWPRIRAELDSEGEENVGQLRKAIGALKEQEAPDIWMKVSEGLETKKSRWRYWYMAASVSLLMVAGYWFFDGSDIPSEQLTYTTEEVTFFDVGIKAPVEVAEADDVLLTYVKENCTRLIATCQDPEFKALLEAYMELDDTKEKLNRQMHQADKYPRMMKYLIKVEKDQAEIGKDMLKKLKSI